MRIATAAALTTIPLLSLFSGFAFAKPRPPLPPLPEPALLSRAGFDEPFWARTAKPESFHPAYTDLVESWSGYALRRTGESVTPFLVSALDGSGLTNVACASGAIRLWFKPDWSSGSLTNGTGPGTTARLAELTAVAANSAAVNWSLNVSPDGTRLSLTGATDNGSTDLLTAAIEWQADAWHLIVLNYGLKGSALFIDGQPVAEGNTVRTVPPDVSALSVGSSLTGTDPAGGEFDEVAAFAGPLTLAQTQFYYRFANQTVVLGPISDQEEAAARELATKNRAERESAEQQNSLLRLVSLNNCDTNGPVRLTNVVCAFSTNAGWTVTFDLVGGTNGLRYDIFSTTNLSGTNIANSQWSWLERGPTCGSYQYTNQPGPLAFYVVGTPEDTDGDGLSDAFELLVSKTDTLVGENRIQSENAITGTTNWLLSNPVSSGPSHGWPTNAADTTPEIEGFASATSVNAGSSLDLYVDVRRASDTNFTVEVYRLGWYGGAGGRKMTWSDSGQPTNTLILPSRKQPIPGMNPTNGLIDCLSGWTTNGSTDTNLIWQRSYTLSIPSNWVSGVYVAKLTTGTNVTPQTTGRQSYIIFVVREDARSSHLLFQSSVTTFEAYNPWGGSSVYPYPYHVQCDYSTNANTVDREGGTVSFNRPYAVSTCDNNLGYGAGAGELLALVNQVAIPGWEYNLIRWLERQGYDVTYATSIDTHRPWPANKITKGFLSVGHDEYWSGMMRVNVETMRDRGVNLGFFSANTCFWLIHFDANYPGERVFSVSKKNETDLWRGAVVHYPEISMIGVQFAGFVDGDITMANPLATNPVVGGVHWAYDHAALTGGQALAGLLGYEVDGCVEGEWCIYVGGTNQLCPNPSTTIRLADSIFGACINNGNPGTGHSYVTIYTTANGAQVFAVGSMQWNWGLDDFASHFTSGQSSRVYPAAQQMTHNVLRQFAGKGSAPVILTNVDGFTSGSWTNLYGSEGYWIADTTPLTNFPSYAQVTLSNQHVQVWGNPTNDPKALLKPGSSNRVASAWTTTNIQGSAFTLDLNLTDTNTHQVALYCADWLGIGTVLEKVEVFESGDTSFAHPLDTRSFQLPTNGVYLVWKLNGHKVIRVAKADGNTASKALVSALFFGRGY